MRKLKYTSSNDGIFVSDNYKKRISDTITHSCLVALDSDMRVVKPYKKKNNVFGLVDTSNSSRDFKTNSSLYYKISEFTYLVECSVVKKEGVYIPKPININIIEVNGEDLVLMNVTTKLHYGLRDLLVGGCLNYLKLRMIEDKEV